MKSIWISRIGREVNLPDHIYDQLVIYKYFFPGNYAIYLGKQKKKLLVKEYELQKPPEQLGLGIDVPVDKPKRNQDMG